MSSISSDLVELHSGDRMKQAEFHRIYKRMPADFVAELIGGIVYVASPLKRRHGTNHLPLGTLLYTYEAHTPGVESGDNTTILLGEESEPQPDLFLRVLPEHGGRSRTSVDDYILGPVEFICEITHSRQAIDLHGKREDYTRHGVLEYLVVSLRELQLRWFDLSADRELTIAGDGILRSFTFPGLWIHAEALLAKDYAAMMATLQAGLSTPEHAEFAARLSASKSPRPRRRKR
jgi:Uma2 family endonuclease